MTLSLNRILALNTASNYALIVVRVLQGILVTRWLYHYLGVDYYGFWSLLWVFFTYMGIFNFGFGAATQKFTAEKIFKNDIEKYNKIMSMIFGFYCLIAFVSCVIIAVSSLYLPSWTRLSAPDKIAECSKALLIFGVGMTAAFPLTMFSDILTGLKLIYQKNSVLLCARIFEALGVLAIIYLDGGFISIVTYSVTINMLSALIIAAIAVRKVAGFSIYAYFERKLFAKMCNFSTFAYLTSVGNLIISRTDRLVLGVFSGLQSVGLYQLSTRLPEISSTLSVQFQDNVMPLSANLIKDGDTAKLRKILNVGMRFIIFVSVGTSVLFFSLCEPTIQFLFAVKNPTITKICRIFLISQFVACVFKCVPARYLLMAGRHKFITISTLIEAVANLLLSIFLCRKIGIMGVIWGTLIPNVIMSGFVIFPQAMRSLNIGILTIFANFARPIAAVLPALAICEFAKMYFKSQTCDILNLSLIYILSGLAYAGFSWFFVITFAERQKILQLLKRGFLKCQQYR